MFEYKPSPHFWLDVVYKMRGRINGTLRNTGITEPLYNEHTYSSGPHLREFLHFGVYMTPDTCTVTKVAMWLLTFCN